MGIDNNGTSVASALNLGTTASDEDIRELEQEPTPEGGGQNQPEKRDPPEGDHDDDPSGDPSEEGEGDERSGRVDTELEDAPDEAAREAIRARRREERLNKKQRSRDKIGELNRRLQDERSQRLNLEARLNNLERTNVGGQIAQLVASEEEAKRVEEQLKAAIAAAGAKQDGVTVAEATTRLIQLETFKTQLKGAREVLEKQAAKPQQTHLDPELVKNAQAFRSKHPWFKGVGAPDEHSKIVAAIDNQLFSEGWDPVSPSYWTELETRAKKYLPERFKEGAPSGQRPYNPGNGKGSQRSPVAGGGGSGGSSGGSQPGGVRQFHLSEARVKAMKESGAWDDPVRKANTIKAFREYDANHKN